MEQVRGKLMRAIKHVGLPILGQRCVQAPLLWAMKRRLQQLDGTITCMAAIVFLLLLGKMLPKKARQDIICPIKV